MPNCCIPGCKNSSHRGYILKCFPKDEKRRAEWIKKINKPNWKPNNTHRVCEVYDNTIKVYAKIICKTT